MCLGRSFTPASVSLLSTLKQSDAGHGKFVGGTPSKVSFTEQPRKTALISALWQFCMGCFVLLPGQQGCIPDSCWDQVGFPRRAQWASTYRQPMRGCLFQVTGRGYFFPRSPSGHFPGECCLALCVGTAPFLILAVSSVQTSWYS